MKYTDKLNLRKPEGGEYYSVEDFNGNADLIDAAITGKINKPAEYTTGNITAFSASGNIEDSGRKPTDFADANHNHDTLYAPIAPLKWLDLPLLNGFNSAPEQPAQYAVDCFGFLHLRGYVYFNGNASVMPCTSFAALPFTLSHSIRVPITADVSIPTNYSDPAVLIILSNGQMQVGTSRYYSFLGGAISLQGVSFFVG